MSAEGIDILLACFLLVIFPIICFIAFFCFLNIFYPKSERHRKLVSNLYVAAKIRQIAKTNNLDLNEELKEHYKTLKEMRKYMQPLDKTIEEELQEQIVKSSESKKE